MSLWDLSMALSGYQAAHSPPDKSGPAPSDDEFEAVLKRLEQEAIYGPH